MSEARFGQGQGTVLHWEESVTKGGQTAGEPVGGVSEQQGESGSCLEPGWPHRSCKRPQQGHGPGPGGGGRGVGADLKESSVGLAGAFCFVSLASSHNSVSGK